MSLSSILLSSWAMLCLSTAAVYLHGTLHVLWFASTAKYMKNIPYVNEVSSDEALPKRYRKEIMDLKKQLEEVSLETRAQAMEKDQLAQLLEEKDLLQKVQIEKIQNLTRMLVTSSSLTSQQELKAKRKRRVTWCLGKINKMKDSNYVDEFNVPANVTTKSQRATQTVLGEIDESLCSESDVFSNILDTLTEVEWNPATKLLSQAQESQENQELSFSMEEKGSETETTTSEEGASEAPFRVEGATLPELGAGRLSLSQGLQEALQTESDQLRENLGEVTAKHQETEKELRIAHHHLKEHEGTIHQLKVALCERETELSSMQKELETAHNELKKKVQELHEKQEQLTTIKESSETQEKMSHVEQLEELLKARDASLHRVEGERLELMERLQESQEEIKIITKERNELKGVQEALRKERDLLKENIEEIKAKGQKIKEELKN
ncbi:centromere-associated protein E-like isoform X3 [Talpa occidentalis]|uniref:centromere-associated protein E-like isoform X3 n=1 Tax=Talpa occidentalis TaxID=50954 RepID=UPI0023F92B23|nr:centromere-associated protein E-like isoform X3 [Talpa occidentalis]